jgi:hypothetical protein
MGDMHKINSNIKKSINTNNYCNNSKLILLLVIPVILIFLFIKLNFVRGYYYMGSNSDPEYSYLLNSLKISELKPPSHIDHPGTTLQLAGGFMIKVLNFNKNANDIQVDVIANSENYILYINILLLLIVVAITALLGIFTYRVTGNIWLGIILQLSVLYSSNTYLELSRVRPEYLLISASLLLALTLISLLKNNLTHRINRYIIVFSLISGFGMATKIIFFPLLLFPLIVLPNIKNKIYYIIGTIISFILFTLPIIGQYGRFYIWIKDLFFHSGQYGAGASTIIDTSSYLNNISLALSGNIIFSITLLVSAIFILVCVLFPKYRDYNFSMEFKILLSLVITQIIQILLVSKHYGAHYLIPSLTLTGVTIVFLIINVKKLFNLRLNKKHYSGIMIIAIIFLYYNVNTFFSVSSSLEKNKNDNLSIINTIANNYKNYTKIYYYRSSSREYALKFGNDFSGNEYSLLLNQYYPNNYFYNIWDNKYYDFNKSIDLDTIININNNVLYEGASFEKHYKNTTYKPNVSLNDVHDGNNETIYLLKN